MRPRLVPARSCARLGSLQLWLLELGRPLGLDLGRLFALGFCSVPLWPLELFRGRLGLVPRSVLWASHLWAGFCRLLRWRGWVRSRLVSSRPRRTVLPVVRLQP